MPNHDPATRAEVAVVMPHGGTDRLPLLELSLANLAQLPHVREVIIAEFGRNPNAAVLAKRWRAKYVFIRGDGEFERARALNTGSRLATTQIILWKDNDLLMQPEFVPRAASELLERQLDVLVPYSAIQYLDEHDSNAVARGMDLSLCRPVRQLPSARDLNGGACLVRKSFLQAHGGIPESFRGWGGEDNAWMVKSALFGRVAITADADRPIWHLYHPDSGAHHGVDRYHAHFEDNDVVLYAIRSVRTAEEYVRRFPRADNLVPWPAEKRVAVLSLPDTRDAGRALATALTEIIGGSAQIETAGRVSEPARPTADAFVLTGDAIIDFLNDPGNARCWSRSIAVLTTQTEWCARDTTLLERCGHVLLAVDDAGLVDRFPNAWRLPVGAEPAAESVAAALIGPLSLILNEESDGPAQLRDSP